MIISLFQGPPLPPSDDDCSENARIIRTTPPLYPHDDVIQLLENNCPLSPITKKCAKDLAKLGKSTAQLRTEIIQGLKKSRYKQAVWCQTSIPDTWAASDAYEMFPKDVSKEYYLKYFINNQNKKIMAVSCHL